MPMTLKDIGKVRDDLKNRRPSSLPQDPDAPLTNRQAVHQLAPALFRLKKRGFKTKELVDILKEYDIKINAATLNRYLEECRSTSKHMDTKQSDESNTRKQFPVDKNTSPPAPPVKQPVTANPAAALSEVKK